MKSFLKLLAFEFERFSKFYGALILLTVASQLIGIIVESRKYVSTANEMLYGQGMTVEQYIGQYGWMSMGTFLTTVWAWGPVLFCLVALVFYSFFIWYREWFGRTTFAYRLLMLPVPRIQIFLSKLVMVFLAVLALIALELGILWLGSYLMQALVPTELFLYQSLTEMIGRSFLSMLIPGHFFDFLFYYVTGLMALTVLFTCILLERSFRGFGVLTALVYAGLAVAVYISPLVFHLRSYHGIFYPSELYLLIIGMSLVLITASIFFSNYLLKRKITV